MQGIEWVLRGPGGEPQVAVVLEPGTTTIGVHVHGGAAVSLNIYRARQLHTALGRAIQAADENHYEATSPGPEIEALGGYAWHDFKED